MSSVIYGRSPLIQESLEISCDVTVTMPETIDHRLIILEKYFEKKIGSFLEPNVIAQTGPSTIQNQQKTNVPTNNKKKADKKK